ncbi:MAG: endonuclease/exonuclease/phosphatase family protein [Candidatus Marinimicrobia bacterium]|nr:endonuclease/exonuclease/phosphatase family protein [Candidatus Neomarinimicrobiota bacterium]MCF7840187.1 endonuclease/exonuclease/phosphatase family protein [Candidatus Neomarinimicrobiota bacterium]
MGKNFKHAAGLLLISTLLQAQSLTVVTINVWSGLDYLGYLKMGEYETVAHREARYQALITELKRIEPDILGLNEANKVPHYAERIARDLGMDEIHHLGIGGVRAGPIGLPVNLREGDVILAKPELSLKWEGRLQLSGGPVGRFFTFHTTDATQVVAGSVQVGNEKVYVFVTHWHASPFLTPEHLTLWRADSAAGKVTPKRYAANKREAEAGQRWREGESVKMLNYIDKIAGKAPLLLMGDFNAMRGMPEIERYIRAGFIDVYGELNETPGYTWDDALNSNIIQYQLPENDATKPRRRHRIDFIFARGDWELIESKVVFNQPVKGIMPSDHFGVLGRLKLRSK